MKWRYQNDKDYVWYFYWPDGGKDCSNQKLYSKLPKFRNIVEIDGKYAIRYGFYPFYKYKDVISATFYWGRNSKHFKDCLMNTIEEAKEHINKASDFGNVVR